MKVGDVVRLRSGGPRMTIVGQATAKDLREPKAFAIAWFEGGEMHTGFVPEPGLVPEGGSAPTPLVSGG